MFNCSIKPQKFFLSKSTPAKVLDDVGAQSVIKSQICDILKIEKVADL